MNKNTKQTTHTNTGLWKKAAHGSIIAVMVAAMVAVMVAVLALPAKADTAGRRALMVLAHGSPITTVIVATAYPLAYLATWHIVLVTIEEMGPPLFHDASHYDARSRLQKNAGEAHWEPAR